MKKYIFFLFLGLSLGANAQFSSAEMIGSYSKQELANLAANLGVPSFIISADYEVDVYRITYDTPDPQGNMTIATGALCIPKSACDFPIASYQHGTVAHKMDVPSFGSPELDVGLLLATTGYIMCLPDYLGLGGSPGLHPYVHGKSEATASIDMVRASKQFADQEGIAYNEQLLLLGYSQGGHSTMAMHKEIEANFSDELTVTASFPLSGPYDISGIQTQVIVSDEPYPTPGYLPYVLLAYNSVYGNLFNDPSEVFQAPYDEILPPLFDGTYSMGEINAMCPSIPNQVLIPAVLDSFRNDSNHRFWVPLRDNDLYDWIPQAPIRIYYCNGDDQVNYMNSIVALDAFQQNGVTDIEATDLGDGDHGECYSPAILATKFQMDSFKAACTTSTNDLEKEYNLEIYPNPSNGLVYLEIPDGIKLDAIHLYNVQGQKIKSIAHVGMGNHSFNLSSLPNGIYFAKAIGNQTFQTKMLILDKD